MKKQQVIQHPIKKQGRNIKEVVPGNIYLPREMYTIKNPVEFDRNCVPIEFYPCEIYSEWNDEEVKIFNFQENNNNSYKSLDLFDDPEKFKIIIPNSLKHSEIKWLRPNEYVLKDLIDREIINRIPNKNHIKIRNKLIELYNLNIQGKIDELDKESDNLYSDIFADDNMNISKKIYNDFIPLLSKKIELYVVKTESRLETDEEFEKRIKLEKEIFNKKEEIAALTHSSKSLKKGSISILKPIVNQIKCEIKDIVPSNINMKEFYGDFSKWVASVFQVIKDLEINDAITNEIIWRKIYPQNNGIPIYNKTGRYWIKLYYMGKPRKIEIDDLMPCNIYENFLLPKCEFLEELWPGLLTKALIKLYSKKLRYHEELIYPSILYSLTGYIPEKISLINNTNELVNVDESFLINLFKVILSDDAYLNKKKYVLGFRRKMYANYKMENEEDMLIHDISEFKKDEDILDKEKENSIDTETFNKYIHKILKSKEFNRQSSYNDKTPLKLLKHLENKNISLNEFIDITSGKRNSGSKLSYMNSSLGNNKNKRSSILIKNDRLSDLNSSDMVNLFTSLNSFNKIKNDQKDKPVITKLNLRNEKFDNTIYYDCLYSVIEFFDNKKFNMKRLKPPDFTDLKQKIKDAKVSYKQLSKKEKKDYLNNLKQIRDKQKLEKHKRIDELSQNGQLLQCIKIKNESIGGQTIINFQYSDEDIQMTKKCLLNNWDYPPINFWESQMVKKEKTIEITSKPGNTRDIINESDEINTSTQEYSPWNENLYNKLIENDNDKYKLWKDPVIRMDGFWINISQFLSFFDNLLILHNPNFYFSKYEVDSNWYNYKTDIYFSEKYVILLTGGQTHPHRFCSSINNPYNNKININKSCLLMKFTANNEENISENNNRNCNNTIKEKDFYILFDILDKNEKLIEQNIKLNGLVGSIQFDNLDFEMDYFLLLKGGFIPVGYHLSIFSDHLIEYTLYQNYLKKYFNFTAFNFKLEHPPLDQNRMYVLMRLSLSLNVI